MRSPAIALAAKCAAVALLLCRLCAPAYAQGTDEADATVLAKKTQNPVGDLGLGITRTTVFNGRPMNIGVQLYGNVEHPDAAAATQLRFVLALLYPNKPHAPAPGP